MKDRVLEPHAEIFTPNDVAIYMLNSIEAVLGHGLTFDNRILEPSAGKGVFVLSIIRRMYENSEAIDWNDKKMTLSITAFEINMELVNQLHHSIYTLLLELGCNEIRAQELVETWIHAKDFLSWSSNEKFDVVVGNPPYIRYDTIGKEKTDALQKQFFTFRGRCDLYVPFIEKALLSLSPQGVLCYICSNRFTKSEYGKELRKFISKYFHVTLYLNLEHANVFGEKIAAYPSIFIIDNNVGMPTYSKTISSLEEISIVDFHLGQNHFSIFPEWYHNDEPWGTTEFFIWVKSRQVQSSLPLLTESAPGTKVGIGIATGNDEVFVKQGPVYEIEADCLLPLVTSDDIRSGRIHGQTVLVNPWNMDGTCKLRNLAEKPGLAKYLKQFRKQLEKRYIANRSSWYRTIDCVNSRLFKTPKIVLPDIQCGGIVGIDEDGSVYPHHNVYWIISSGWPLHLLAAILRSDFVIQQIRWSSTEIRGGNIRYQAKNLKMLRIPPRSIINEEEESILIEAYIHNKTETINSIVDNIVNRCLQNNNVKSKMPQQLMLKLEA